MTVTNDLNVFTVNANSINGSAWFAKYTLRDARALLWQSLLNFGQEPHVEHISASPKVRRVVDAPKPDEEEVVQAVNTLQIGIMVRFDDVPYAQAHDRSEHRFALKVQNLKMHADYLVSDFKVAVDYELKNFNIEIPEE